MLRNAQSTVTRFALVLTAIAIPMLGSPTEDVQSLKATVEVISQKSCRDNERTYSIIQKLRVTFTNSSKKNLIVDKRIGSAFYSMVVAHDVKSLSEGRYEWRPNPEWSMDPLPGELRGDSPAPPFVIMAPNESFRIEADFWVMVRQRDSDQISYAIRSGDHVSQLLFGSWFYLTKPEEVQERWKSFGDLVYKTVKTEPLAFNLLPEPKFENCK